MTIEGAISNLQAKLLALPGIKSAPEKPPEAVMAYPFAVSYERTGVFTMESQGIGKDLVTIWCEIHVSRVLLGSAIQTAMAFRDPFLRAIMADPTLGGEVSTVNTIRRTFGQLVWNTVDTIGYRFEVDVKVKLIT